MYGALLAIVISLAHAGYSVGVMDTKIGNNAEKISDVRQDLSQLAAEQQKVNGIQTELAVQGAAIDDVEMDVEKVQRGQEQLQRDFQDLRLENAVNFDKVLEGIDKLTEQ